MLQRPHKVARVTTLLGVVLDLQLELQGGRKRLLVTEWEGWALLTDNDGMDRAEGRARLYLVPFVDTAGKFNAPRALELGAETYKRWHERRSDDVLHLDVPDSFAHEQGRVLRIGYRSDKWRRRGDAVDYDHDFREDGATAPKLYTDSRELQAARGAVITGGSMRVTEAGID
jgi:hypothetical protein